MRVIRFDEVAFGYGERAAVFRDLTLSIAAGSFHFLTGPSGAGKSTFLKLLLMGLRPTGGRLEMFGRDSGAIGFEERATLRRRIGVVFQDNPLLEHLTVWDNVALPVHVSGAPESDYSQDVSDLLQWVGLGERMRSAPQELSGGERQRAGIARAVIGKPDLLLADEPTGSVDAAMKRRLLRLFLELNRLGTTIILATHDRELLAQADQPVLRIAEQNVLRQEPRATSKEA